MVDGGSGKVGRTPEVAHPDEFSWLPAAVASDILSVVSDGILITSRDGIILQANESFSRLCMHERWELEGTSIALVAAETEDPASEITSLLGTDQVWTGITQIRRGDGRVIECDTWIRPFDADEGSWWVSVQRRTSIRRRYGTATVDEVVATAHDLVNSLASLRGYVALLERVPADQAADVLARLKSVTGTTTERLERLVGELRAPDLDQSSDADTLDD